jgi:hypothetical protein
MDTLLLVDYDITAVLFVPVPYKYIDQCKDTYCGEEGVPYRYKLKERS